MVVRRLPNYLKMYRKKHGFTQNEIAHLIGCGSLVTICNYENGDSLPTLRNLIGYEVIFGASPKELFGGIYDEVIKNSHAQARRMLHKLSSQPPDAARNRKVEFLKTLLAGEIAPINFSDEKTS